MTAPGTQHCGEGQPGDGSLHHAVHVSVRSSVTLDNVGYYLTDRPKHRIALCMYPGMYPGTPHRGWWVTHQVAVLPRFHVCFDIQREATSHILTSWMMAHKKDVTTRTTTKWKVSTLSSVELPARMHMSPQSYICTHLRCLSFLSRSYWTAALSMQPSRIVLWAPRPCLILPTGSLCLESERFRGPKGMLSLHLVLPVLALPPPAPTHPPPPTPHVRLYEKGRPPRQYGHQDNSNLHVFIQCATAAGRATEPSADGGD